MIVDVGTVLGGRYRLTRAVASGGMGTVYEAFQEDLGRRVAIKVLRAHLAQPEDIARLEREARAAASLGHPHIGQVFDFVPGNPPFVVMELLEGATLGQLLRQERVLAGPRAARLVSQVLAALDAAHRAGIVHRDIKPSNVFVVQTPTLGEVVKVLDFGVAKLLQHAPSLTAHGDTVGTLPYMSPEQFSARPVDRRSDVFSVGLVLYEALGGHRAYEGGDPGNLARRVMHGEVPSLARRAPWVDPALAAIVTRAIAFEPSQRFASAAEMAEALAAWTSSARAPTADGTSAHRDLGPLPSAAAPTLTTGIQPRPWGVGRWLALGGLAVVAFAVGLGVMELDGARAPLPAPSHMESGVLPPHRRPRRSPREPRPCRRCGSVLRVATRPRTWGGAPAWAAAGLRWCGCVCRTSRAAALSTSASTPGATAPTAARAATPARPTASVARAPAFLRRLRRGPTPERRSTRGRAAGPPRRPVALARCPTSSTTISYAEAPR